ncbi:MAG TPA: TetR family transcriptional regulator [Ornithinibacter sp.]|nr:TetR family transcriptional regulator [Ornithinibacter sp.]
MPPRGRRPAGGPDTREAVLAAARELFAERGYERTTIRAVAAAAGVDPALVHHHFGTKERLLAEAITLPISPEVVLDGVGADPDRLGPEIAERVILVWETQPDVRERMLAMLRSGISHERAAGLLRDLLGRTMLRGLGDLAAPDCPELRTSLVGTQLGGLMLGRYVLRVPGVADATPEQLIAAVGPVLQHYLRGDLGSSAVDKL